MGAKGGLVEKLPELTEDKQFLADFFFLKMKSNHIKKATWFEKGKKNKEQ